MNQLVKIHSLLVKNSILLAIMLLFCCIPGSGFGQKLVCDYDRNHPTVENARVNFKSLKYKCAQQELQDLLEDETINLETRANAHVLMAAVYYALIKDDEEKKQKTIDQFKKAFQAYRDWKGELDIQSDDFKDLMNTARFLVDNPQATATRPPAKSSGCPSSTTALISSGVFAASVGLYLYSSSRASDKWDDYIASGTYPQNLYDNYKSANNLKKVSGVVTVAAGAVTGYLWFKYLKGRKKCNSDTYGLIVNPTSNGLLLSFSF